MKNKPEYRLQQTSHLNVEVFIQSLKSSDAHNCVNVDVWVSVYWTKLQTLQYGHNKGLKVGCDRVKQTPALQMDVDSNLWPSCYVTAACSWFPSSLSQRHSRMTNGGLVVCVCVCVCGASLVNRGGLFSSLYQRGELSSLLMRTTSPTSWNTLFLQLSVSLSSFSLLFPCSGFTVMLYSRGITQTVDGGRHLVNGTGKTNSPVKWKDSKTKHLWQCDVLLRWCHNVYKEWKKKYVLKLFCNYYFI